MVRKAAYVLLSFLMVNPCRSVGSVQHLRTGDRWFDLSHLGQYSFQGLMIAIEIGFIPVSPLSVVSIMNICKRSQWLAKSIVQSTGNNNSTEINGLVLKMALNTVKSNIETKR